MAQANVIDMRSDTVTRPTREMYDAMLRAPLGDDVFGDDPTVNLLQERVADLLGKEAALFVPSGTMANEVCIRAHTEPGDELIAEGHSHCYYHEGGAPAALSGVQTRFIESDRGVFTGAALEAMLRPPDQHHSPTRLVVIENTHNGGGGKVWPVEGIEDVARVCRERGFRLHMDGARVLNAAVASGVPARRIARSADTVSTCFSKGLGAPVGSAVAGTADVIARAHRFRKIFGGAMRQAGILAAACLYALDHHVERLAEDHANARRFAEIIAEAPAIHINPTDIETNLIYFAVDEAVGTAEELCARLHERGVWMLPLERQRCRAVTHLDVSAEQVERAARAVAEEANRST
jgi:threonine aldolase